MKRSSRKVSHKKSTKKQQIVWYGYMIVAVGIFLLFILGNFAIHHTKVLGQSTVLLARGGDDGGGGGGDDHGGGGGSSGGGGGSNSGGNSGGSNSGNGGDGNGNSGRGNDTGRDTNGNRGNQSGSAAVGNTNPETTVDCIGPDGKHFATTFQSCNDLNNAWGKKNWTFNAVTPAVQPTTTQETPKHETLEVKVEDAKANINIKSKNTQVELEINDDKLKVKAKESNGAEVELEQEDGLKKVNEALNNEGIEIEHATESGELHIKDGPITAKTALPISVNPATNALSVTTPTGTKEVSILPNAAVESVLATHILDKQNKQVELIADKNEPVFKISGIDDKKLFGFIPISLEKTAFVSAANGTLVKTEESPVSHLLDILSR